MRTLVVCLLIAGCQSQHSTPSGNRLQGKRIAILATDGVEQIELTAPKQAFELESATTVVISPQPRHVQAFNGRDKGDQIKVDLILSDADASDFDALLLPGGVVNPDALRIDARAVRFVKAFVEAEKPIFAICHGAWMLVETGAVRERLLTSWPSLKTDITNAGGSWIDVPVVIDRPLVTSRNPNDIPQFVDRAIEVLSEQTKLSGVTF